MAAPQIFARIVDIKGESKDAKHPDEIEVLSFSWGVSHTSSAGGGGGGGAGKAVFQDLSITHGIDRATPLLLKACATGVHIRDATISHRRAGAGQTDHLVVKLSDVLVTGVTHTGGDDEPYAEVVTLRFAKVDFEYRPQKPDGSADTPVSFRYDLVANSPF